MRRRPPRGKMQGGRRRPLASAPAGQAKEDRGGPAKMPSARGAARQRRGRPQVDKGGPAKMPSAVRGAAGAQAAAGKKIRRRPLRTTRRRERGPHGIAPSPPVSMHSSRFESIAAAVLQGHARLPCRPDTVPDRVPATGLRYDRPTPRGPAVRLARHAYGLYNKRRHTRRGDAERTGTGGRGAPPRGHAGRQLWPDQEGKHLPAPSYGVHRPWQHRKIVRGNACALDHVVKPRPRAPSCPYRRGRGTDEVKGT